MTLTFNRRQQLVLFQPSVWSTWGDESLAPQHAGRLLPLEAEVTEHGPLTGDTWRETAALLVKLCRKKHGSCAAQIFPQSPPPLCCA